MSLLHRIIFIFFVSATFLYSCSPKSTDLISNKDRGYPAYDQLINKINVYGNQIVSEKEKLSIYVMFYLQEGLNSGAIIKAPLTKYTYLIDCHISEIGKIESVSILNSENKDDNEKNLIKYLKQMPQCTFWKLYSGADKEATTSVIIPLRF